VGGALAAGTALAFPAPAGAQRAVPRRGGMLRTAYDSNPASLDPMTGRNASDFQILYVLYDPLVDIDPVTLELKPGLATSWSFATPRSLVLELRRGVTFHDGTPFDATAAKFNLDRSRTDPRSNAKADLASVDAVEVDGPFRITLHLNEPNTALPTILSDRVGCMVSPKSIADAPGGNVDRTPVGTGAMKFESWRDNDSIALTRNPRYWKPGLPYLDGLTFAIINDDATRLRSVVAGETDLAPGLTIRLKPLADRSSNVVSQLSPSMGMIGAYLNFGKPPLNDVRIRRALNYGVDRESFNKVVALGLSEPACTILPKEHWACDPRTAGAYPHDPVRARKLVGDAGFPNGIDIEMVGWSDQASVQWQEVIASQLAEAGIRLKVIPFSPQESSVKFFGPEKFGAGRISRIAGRPDPSQEYDNFFGKDAYFNAGGIELPGYRPLYEATITAAARPARKAAFAKLQAFVLDNALIMPMLFNTSLSVLNPKVKSFAYSILDKPKFAQVWLDA
jgi:peptide/nickel transport system substrate-binding protein/glutathione transport system substrate-binding protein